MTGVEAMKIPENPPITNIATKASALSIAVLKRMAPPQIVPSQLKKIKVSAKWLLPSIGTRIILNLVSFVTSLTVQKLVLALIFLGGVIAAPFITNELLAGNHLPLVAILSLLGAVFFLSFVGRSCWVLMPAFLGLNGKLNFLPANLSMLEAATIISLFFLLYDTIYKKNLRLSLGPSWIWIPSLLFLGIIFYHWAKSGDIGLRIFGGETYGGRKNWTLFIGFISMPILYSMVKPGDPLLRWVPFFYFLAVVADFIPFVLTTVLPPVAPFVYRW